MRPQSLKKQKERRISTKLENAIKENLEDTCEVCGYVKNLDRHHIAAGAHRRELANFRSTQYVCRSCHMDVQGTPPLDQVKETFRIDARAVNAEFGRQVVDMELLDEVLKLLI